MELSGLTVVSAKLSKNEMNRVLMARFFFYGIYSFSLSSNDFKAFFYPIRGITARAPRLSLKIFF